MAAIVGSPLDWPARRDRTPPARRGPLKSAGTFVQAANALVKQVEMIVVEGFEPAVNDVTVFTNVTLKPDGYPYAGRDRPDDPGASVRFRVGDRWYALACDRWQTPAMNLAALAKAVEKLRGVARLVNRDDFAAVLGAFAIVPPTPQPPKPPPGPPPREDFWWRATASREYTAPPPPPRPPRPPQRPSPRPAGWSVTLGVTLPCSRDDVDRAYRRLAMQHHPDRGGDVAQMQRVNDAYAEFQRQYPPA